MALVLSLFTGVLKVSPALKKSGARRFNPVKVGPIVACLA
jgi:hypothetical protein